MPTAEKAATLKRLSDEFRGAKSLFFADYRGLDVGAMTELRARFHEQGIRFKVAKNTLTRLALVEAGLPTGGDQLLTGPTGIAISGEDELAAAKVLAEFAKGHELLEIKGGIMDGAVLERNEVKTLAALPGKDGLIAGLLASMESSLGVVIGVAGSLVRDVLSCAEQVAEKAEASE